MKIDTLLELIDTKVSTLQSNNKFKHEKDNRVRHRLAYGPRTGYYGRVHDGGDPHTVNKVPFRPEVAGADGYYEYIKYLVENKIYDHNPYAPRVYKFKTITDNVNNLKYKIELEKLTPFRELDVEVARSIGVRIAGEETFDDFEYEWVQRMGEERGTHIAVSKVLEEIINDRIKSPDSNLEEIATIIRNLSYEIGADVDVHNANIMLRLSPYPQLVIVDPLAQ